MSGEFFLATNTFHQHSGVHRGPQHGLSRFSHPASRPPRDARGVVQIPAPPRGGTKNITAAGATYALRRNPPTATVLIIRAPVSRRRGAMIIWGTYVIKKVISTGQFYC